MEICYGNNNETQYGFGTAASEAMKKWDGGHSSRGINLWRGLPPPSFWGPGVLPPGNL